MALQGVLGFLGYGNMGSAILEGLIELKAISPKRVRIYDPLATRTVEAERLGATISQSAAELAQESDIIVLAVKPQSMDIALQELNAGFSDTTLIISIAAGISIAFIRKHLGAGVRVVRVMPNTPALVQAGAAGLAPSENCSEADVDAAWSIFSAIGIAEIVSEADIDAVTALSGSGPAYFFYMVEALVKAAVAEGLEEAVATRLASQTLLGAGRLLASSSDSVVTLREKVTSKGGTTEAALNQFRADNLEGVVAAAVHAAAARSRELGA